MDNHQIEILWGEKVLEPIKYTLTCYKYGVYVLKNEFMHCTGDKHLLESIDYFGPDVTFIDKINEVCPYDHDRPNWWERFKWDYL